MVFVLLEHLLIQLVPSEYRVFPQLIVFLLEVINSLSTKKVTEAVQALFAEQKKMWF